MVMKRFVFLPFIFFIFSILFNFSSCEAGLGSAVDTEPPQVSVEYPPSNSIIRESFILAGECSDDEKVSKIEVTIEGYEGSYLIPEVKLDEDATFWQVEINAKSEDGTYPLKDGKYTFNVVAYDGVKRKSGVASRTVEIDNTKPIFVIKSPGITDIQNPTSYGSIFKVSGRIADDHVISSLKLSIFDAVTNAEKASWTEEKVDTAGGTEIIFAQYDKNSDYPGNNKDGLNDRYLNIYGEKSSGDKNFYCTVEISDEAGIFRTPKIQNTGEGGSWNNKSDDNNSGNATTKLYLYDKVYTEYMGKNSKYKLTESDFKRILNGTYESSTESRNAAIDSNAISELKTKLSALFTDTKTTKLAFKLNKDANPYYEFAGYALSPVAQGGTGLYAFGENKASKGSKVTFTAKAGLDGTYISPANITVFLFGPYETSEITQDLKNKIYSNTLDYQNPDKEDEDFIVLYDGTGKLLPSDKYSGSSVENFSKTLTLDKISDGKKYFLAACGVDEDGLELVKSTTYGFEGLASGNPPTIKIVSPAKNAAPIDSSGSMEVSGTISTYDSTIKSLSYTVTVYNELKGSEKVGTITGNAEVDSGQKDDDGNLICNWKFNIKEGTSSPEGDYTSCLAKDDDNYKYEINILGTNSLGLDGVGTTTLVVDAKKPELTDITVTPIALVSETNVGTVNGEITLKVNVQDSYLEKTILEIIQDGETKETHTYLSNISLITEKINTTLYADKKDLNFRATAIDRAGNKNSVEGKCYIDQSTDNPVINITGAQDSTVVENAGEITEGKNLFKTNARTLSGSVTDDDGLSKVTITVKDSAGTQKDLKNLDVSGATRTISYPLPEAEGNYTVIITAEDTNGGNGNPIKKKTVSKTYYVAVDSGAPVFASDFTPASGNYFSISSPMTVKGTITDGSSLKSIKAELGKLNNATGVVEYGTGCGTTKEFATEKSFSEKTGSFSLSDKVTPPNADGTYYVRYIATDIYGQTSDYTIMYYVDFDAPAFEVTGLNGGDVSLSGGSESATVPTPPDAIYLNKQTGYLEVSGIVKDEVSGLDGFIYYTLELDDQNLPETEQFKPVYSAEGIKDWLKAAITTENNKDGTWSLSIPVSATNYESGKTYKLYIAFKDKAGNVSNATNNPSGIISVIPDGEKPVIETFVSDVQGITNDNKDTDVNLTVGGVSDSLSGIKSVELYENGTKIGDFTGSTGTYIYKIAKTEKEGFNKYENLYKSGVHTFEVKAIDNVGNVSESKTLEISVDTEAPTVTIISISPRVSKNGTDYLNGTVTVNAILQDETSLADGTNGTGNCSWYVKNASGTKIDGIGGNISIDASQIRYRNLELKIDTTKITANAETCTLVISAIDKAKNKKEESYELKIDQITDIPVITFNKNNDDKLGIEGKTIQITAKDDDEIGLIEYKFDGGDKKTLFTRDANKKQSEVSYTITLPDGITTGSHTLSVTVKDYVEGRDTQKTKTSTLSFIYDNDNPNIAITEPTENSVQKNAITIKGTASDASGIASVVGKLYKDGVLVEDSTVTSTLEAVSGSTTNFTWSVPVTISTPDETAIYKWSFTATDNNGRPSETSVSYKVDINPPVFVDNITDKITFKAGQSTYYTSNGSAADTTKQIENVWFKEGENSITITGKLTETNPDHLTIKIGGAAAVEYSTPTPSYSVNATYSDGTNSVVLTAYDKAGNPAIKELTLKVDTKAPRNVSASVTDGNGYAISGTLSTKKIKVSYNVTDIPEGLASIDVSGLAKVLIGAKYGFAEAEALYNDDTFTSGETTHSISDKEINLENKLSSGQNTIYIRLIDVAGNKTEEEIASFVYDADPPTVNIVSPVANATVNKTITIRGTVSDNQELPTTLTGRLQIKTESAGTWADVTGGVITNTGTNWSCTLDTTEYNATGNNQTVQIRVLIKDKAGNENTEDTGRQIVINQDTDRPKINLTNINVSGTSIKQSKTVYGTISDDDSDSTGVVKGLWIIKKSSWSTEKYPSVDNDNGWAKLSVDTGSGSWSYDATGEPDGLLSFYLYCIDNAGTPFYWNASSNLSKIKIAGKSDTSYRDESGGISYTSDMAEPTIEFKVARNSGTPELKDYSSGGIVFSKTSPYNNLWMRLEIYEAVGMKKDGDNLAKPIIYLNSKVLSLATDKYNLTTHTYSDTEKYNYVYTVGPIDLSTADTLAKDGQWLLAAEVYDAAEQKGRATLNITMDSNAPEILINSPTAQTSDAVMSAITVKGLAQDSASTIKSLAWAIPIASKDGADSQYTVDNSGLFTPIGNSTAWEINFSSGAQDTSDSLLYYVNANSGGVDVYNIKQVTGASGIYEVPIYFYVEDSVGNKAVRKKTSDGKPLMVYVDKDGGKPKAWINSPENNSITSGLLTIYGGASDNISVDRVEFQVDLGNGYGTSDYTSIKTGTLGEAAQSACEKSSTDNDWWIKAIGTNSWKFTINTASIANNQVIKIRCRAWDGDNLTRDWGGEIKVKIDNAAPVIRNVKLIQVGANGTESASIVAGKSIIAEREYTSGMYISNVSVSQNGKWYLTASVTDDGGLDSIKTDTVNISTSTHIVDLPQDIMTSQYSYGSDNKSKTIYIPIDTTQTGMVYSTLTARDSSSGVATKEIRINIDSTPPSIYDTDGMMQSNAGEKLRLKPSNSQNPLGESVKVENSNGLFTFGDYVQEADSGLAYLAFYFERESGSSGSSKKIYDPMVSPSGSTYSTTTLAASATSGSVYKNAENLPALYLTDLSRTSEASLSHSSISGNVHIRKGGILKIGGSYRLITNVSGNTISFTPSCATSFTTAEVVFAQIVNHQITESVKNGVVDPTTDDGDRMIESVNHIGSSYIWTASIDSTNIADGPIYIGVIAIDNAGNVSYGRIKTMVSNNRPRIAKVMLATDLNGNNRFDYSASEKTPSMDITGKSGAEFNKIIDLANTQGRAYGEFSFYPTIDGTTGKAKDDVELASGGFKVIGALCVLPEFVGGNGVMNYIMQNASSKTDTNYTQPSYKSGTTGQSVTGILAALKTKTELLADADNGLANKNVSGGATVGDIVSEKGGVIITPLTGFVSLTFWDSTEETTPGKNSQFAHLMIPIDLLSDESEKPVPTIDPLYWKSKGDNSVYKTGNADTGWNLQGHIDLKGDFDGSVGYSGQTNDKVSGRIVFEGTVTDNVRLETITVSWSAQTTKTQVLTYSSGTWSQTSNSMDTNFLEDFEIVEDNISQAGHVVKWRARVNTEYLANSSGTVVYAGNNQSLNVTATDWKNNSPASATTYTVDVVPYVTGIWTSLSEFYRSAPSVYARTAKGKYPVHEGEEITIYGYNLSTGMSAKVGSTSLTNISAYSGESRAAMTGTAISATVPTSATSGKLTITVNSVEASNNKNKNGAFGDYTGSDEANAHHYNMQPNGVNNNLLDDDLYLDVWQFKKAAEPMNGAAEYVTMKINPENSVPGFSYANSILYFNMPGYEANQGGSNLGPTDGVGAGPYSQLPVGMNYGGFSHNTFTFDKNGYAYGVAMCTDTSKAAESAFLQFFSREASYPVSNMDQNQNYANQHNASRIDSSSVKIYDNDNGYMTNINRVQSPVMEAGYNGSLTYVYMAYYDDAAKQVRFRWGTVGSQPHHIDGRKSNWDKNNDWDSTLNNSDVFAHTGNNYGLSDIVNEFLTGIPQGAQNSTVTRPNNLDDSYVKYSGVNHNGVPIQIVAATGISGAKTEYKDAKNVGGVTYSAGRYVALSVVNKDSASPVAVVSWYDEKSRNLYMAYNTAPLTGNTWTYRKIDSEAGLNVKTAVDASGGIHFAYYKSTGSDLKYAYLSSYDTTENPKVCVVDSFGAVGAKCTIDVAKVGSNYVPYIGYQNNGYLGTQAAAKVAYRTDFDSSTCEGSDGKDFLTGKWEVSVVPTTNIPNDDLINLGLSKKADGTMQEFNTGTNKWTSGTDKSFSNSVLAVGKATTVYANGTSNPVMGYGIDDGTIEMAQKK